MKRKPPPPRPRPRLELERLRLVGEIASRINASFDLITIFRAAVPKLRRVLPFRRASIALVTAGRTGYTLPVLYDAAAAGFVRRDDLYALDAGLPGKAIATGKAIRVGRFAGTAGIRRKGEHAISALIVPLRLAGEVIGTLNLGGAGADEYGGADLDLAVLLGHQLETALRHSKFVATIREQRDALASDREEVQRARSRLEALIDASDAAILMVTDGLVVYANEPLRRLADLEGPSIIGGTLEHVRDALPAGLLDAEAARRLSIPGGGGALLRDRVERSDPRRVYQRTIAPVHDPAGAALGHVLLYRDITEESEVEAAKAEFVSVVSHELRTPLTSVKTSLGLLLDGVGGALSATTREFVEIALRNLGRLIRLVEDLLDLSRIERGRLGIVLAPVAVNTATTRAVEAVRALLHERPIHLEHRPATPDIFVLAEADRLEQVIVNLLSNAIKFSPPEGQVTFGWRIDGEAARFELTDQGPGIPADQREAIFEKFRQLDGAATRRYGGAGLGLAITRELVRAFGGEIRAEGVETGGARFTVRLPLAATPPVARRAAIPIAPAGSATVLVVHGEQDERRVIETLLSRAAFTVHLADTGAHALELARRVRPQVIAAAVHMPDMHGLDLLRHLREVPSLVDVPTLLVGSNVSTATAIAYGGDGDCNGWDEPLLQALRQLAAAPRRRVVAVLDDDPALRGVLLRTLRHAGYAGVGLPDGDTALAWMRERVPDLLLTDMHLPLRDGLSVLHEMRSDTALQGVPIIILTAFADAQMEQAAAGLGVPLLRKPFETESLLREMERLLARVPAP